MTKHEPRTELPIDFNELEKLAKEREEWAADAIVKDMHGSAREFELTALALREVLRIRASYQAKVPKEARNT